MILCYSRLNNRYNDEKYSIERRKNRFLVLQWVIDVGVFLIHVEDEDDTSFWVNGGEKSVRQRWMMSKFVKKKVRKTTLIRILLGRKIYESNNEISLNFILHISFLSVVWGTRRNLKHTRHSIESANRSEEFSTIESVIRKSSLPSHRRRRQGSARIKFVSLQYQGEEKNIRIKSNFNK